MKKEPKNRILAPKSPWSCDIYIGRKFHMELAKIYIRGSKRRKEALRAEPKNGIRAQNQYNRVL
jgi:hypothetical protein